MTTEAQDILTAGVRFIPIIYLSADGIREEPLRAQRAVFGYFCCCQCGYPAAIILDYRGGGTTPYCGWHSPLRLDRPDVPNDYVPSGARYGTF